MSKRYEVRLATDEDVERLNSEGPLIGSLVRPDAHSEYWILTGPPIPTSELAARKRAEEQQSPAEEPDSQAE